MKTRNGFVSNSSSSSFVIDTSERKTEVAQKPPLSDAEIRKYIEEEDKEDACKMAYWDCIEEW